VVTTVAHGALRLVAHVRRNMAAAKPARRGRLLRHCRTLLRVIDSDLEGGPDGRLVVARKVARDRIISFTDPDARHGRKSRKSTFKGYKFHLLGDAVSGLVAAVAVTPANTHDMEPCPRLLKQAKRLIEDLDRLYGDHAYGTGRTRRLVTRLHGVDLVAPPPPVHPTPSGRFGKADFVLDPDNDTATCPAGRPSDGAVWHWSSANGVHQRAHWWAAKTCADCSLFQRCRADTGHRRYIRFAPYESDNLAARNAWSNEALRRRYRRRGPGERLVNSVVRRGARKAQSWGLHAANTQAHLVAATVNLHLLAQALAEQQTQV
jgi:hypothetical protein